MTGQVSLDQVRAVLAETLKDEPLVAAAYAYGSQVAGRPSLLSDLDVAFVLVAGAKRDDPLFAERLASGLAVALDSAVEIDANVVDDLPLPVLGRVVTEGILLYESDPVRRVEFETSTRRLYFDFLPFLERDAREGLKARG
jgi:predicted nucleotidyltransferase